MPQFQPGLQDGKKIDVPYALPISLQFN
ncbi:MAG: hypothetical protein ACTHY4_04315 [Flavobacteriaceae bacterium]